MEIYEIENPFWLSDIFIFEYIDKVGYCYVKVNYQDKIEEIGINISKRMHNQSIANIFLKAKKLQITTSLYSLCLGINIG